ncbi:hypothetical protein Taro_052570 [Colocasia esculenta]|uniref:DNA polymerase zeta catalytic subunit n=1 Tax=Colocasia esculenta TaxID=4460 RepID=A0A843XKH4_COLES|nr:hypothetical protein [Colocasia esculenta]
MLRIITISPRSARQRAREASPLHRHHPIRTKPLPPCRSLFPIPTLSPPVHSPAAAGANPTMSSTPQSSPPSSGHSPVFSIRIVSLDYYMAPPVPGLDFCESLYFQGRRVEQVPVIRIYGSTLAGQKACLHVHRVLSSAFPSPPPPPPLFCFVGFPALPYLYVPCSEVQASNKGQSYTSEISYAIEKALQLRGTCGLKRQHVHGCCLVRAKKFYGYHSTEELFVKIYLYNPADVARVAALLLGGSILNRSIQPYESHIPFLLQFMVDYNLYGMAHLHTSKVMFRHPLPDKFVPRTARYTVQNDSAFEKLTSVSASLQADSSLEGHAALWLSSTVPKEWSWTTLVNDNEAPDGINTFCIKKQSNCELEGDSSVDDILNQRAKLYSSLSQTGPDMKMVQSLIPIWEEEYERSGVQECVGSPNMNKPLPDAVLKGMCDGLYEHVLSNIHTEAQKVMCSEVPVFEGDKKLEPQSKSFTHICHFVAPPEDQKPCHSDAEPSLNPKGKRNVSATLEGSSSVEGDATSQRICEFAGSSSSSQKIVPSAMIGSKEGKVADVEALELLSWLTSSQVAQDLSDDDELAHETILSPLLSSKNYETALEKAHLDYEIASQQECQEILDSLDDFQPGVLEEKAASSSNHNCSISTPLVNVIPQVDGSSDDQSCFPKISEASDKIKMDMISSSISGKNMTNRFVGKQRRNHLLWGPLPFYIRSKKPEDSCSFNANSDDLPPYGVNNVTDAGSSPGSETSESCEASGNESGQQLIEMKEGRQVTGSVRDLMRKKRRYHVEQFEHGGHLSGEMAAGNEWKTIPLMEKADSQSRDSNEDSMMPFEAPHIKSYILKRHGPSTCLESRTSTGTYTGGPSEVLPSAEWHNQHKGKLSFMPSADCFQVDAQNKHLDPHEAPSTREFCYPSVGLVEPGDEKLLQSDPGLTHSRKLLSVVFPECPKESSNHESLGSLKLKSGSTAHTFIQECHKGTQATDLRASYTPAVEESAFCENSYSNTRQWINACKTFSEVHPNNFTNVNPTDSLNLNALQINNSGHGKCDTRICKSCTATQKDPNCAKFVEMTFNRKPPLLEKISGSLENSQSPAAGVVGNMTDAYLSYAERQRPDLPPFFSDNETEKMDHKSFLTEGYLEAVRGVPVHFQNDGSLSYLLTFAVSPPSRYSVCQWLLGQAEQNVSCQSNEHSSKIDNHSGHVSQSHNFCSHDDKTSTSPRAIKSMSARLDSQGFAGNPYSDSPLLPVPCCTKNLIENFSDKCDTSVNSRNVLHSEVVETNKLQGASFDREGRIPMSCYFDTSQISGPNEKSKPTPLSQIGFRDPAGTGGGQNLTLFSVEILAESRGNLLPDPQFDAINLVALAIQEDTDDNAKLYVFLRGGDMKSNARNVDGMSGCTFLIFPEERGLFDYLVKMIGLFDPDILLGWEIQGSSIGFLAERAAHLGIRLLKSISRTPAVESKHETKASLSPEKEVTNEFASERVSDSIVLEDAIIEDEWGRNHASGIHVGGRIVLNVWRLMRSELKLSMYSIEAVAEEVLRHKIPCIPVRTLNKWFLSGSQRARFRCIEYVLERANLNLQIMNQLDMINRTSELARVFGIDFFSVLSRGSQFRVESMLLRLAHTQNYLAISPGNQQVASQPAMECLPLVLEPESGFYADPVVVLDFQSLYPSMIIAYNLCYCTCLGRGLSSRGNVLGVSSFSPDPHLLIDLKEQMLLTPNGVMYVPSKVRRGVLPCLLDEILSTRIMVKKAMKKLLPSNLVLQRVLNARQLALKLIANVTYGYTAAGFSGRMPCAELADSIVQCGRKTLEMAISLINSHSNWNARVVYGDTDRGRSLEDAFKIGNEIASTITSMNPKPVTLKMEKVYYPCFLLTKKRYVGYSYESPTQEKPSFDAKGIETVRRDTCPAVAKTMEKSLRMFFEHQDVAKVKSYLQSQWKRILSGKVSLQDFVFAKEVRLGTYSSRAPSLPPAAIVAVKALTADPRSEPRYGERVPYVVVHGEPGARLVDMVVDPLELLEINSPYRLNDIYYINKQIIPALQRAFGLLGVDLNQWFSEIPRPVRPTVAKRHSSESSLMSAAHGFDDAKDTSKRNYTTNRIDKYYLSKHCAVCGNLVQASAHLCDGCSNKGPLVASVVVGRTSKLERDIHHLSAICRHCGGGDWIVESGVKCTSLACSVFYERRKVQKELQTLSAVATDAGFYPRCVSEWF